MTASITPLRIVIAGGGIGALEALMALRDLGEGQLAITVVAPKADVVLRPMAVAVPFSAGHGPQISLAETCAEYGAELYPASVASVDAVAHAVDLTDGARLHYDRLILATGAATRPAYRSALTFDDADPTELNGLLADIDEGYCHSLAVVIPPSGSWALPAYELALLIAREARAADNQTLAIHLVTPEPEPLAIFGPTASASVARLLRDAGVELHTGAYATIDRPGEIVLAPAQTQLTVQRIVALPVIVGRRIPGVPADEHGFVPVDDHGRVIGQPDVYAVGDGADFPVKQGGLATQQADAAARDIAASAGAPVAPEPFQPVLRGTLLTGAQLWSPAAKVIGRYLTPFLGGPEPDTATATAPGLAVAPEVGIAVDVTLSSDRATRPLVGVSSRG